MWSQMSAKFNYNRLCIDKVLGDWKSDNKHKTKTKYNIRSPWGPISGAKSIIAPVNFPKHA